MDYTKLLRYFWQLRRANSITSVQTDLYLCLLNESNGRGRYDGKVWVWQNPMVIKNGLICASIGITEKTLIDARNRLQQLGLISFKGGITKKQAPTYYILEYWNNYSNEESNKESFPVSNEGSIPGSNDDSIEANINSIKSSNSNLKLSSEANASGPAEAKKAAGGKKAAAGAGFPHWQKMVDAWFDFYVSVHPKKGQKPSFDGREPKALHEIALKLKARSDEREKEWTEAQAVQKLKNFLQAASVMDWLKDNYLLHNMHVQYDVIVNQNDAKRKISGGGGNSTRGNDAGSIIQPGGGFFG